ncbi:restriction endonuclease, partial [Ureibacillus sinduriensis]
MAKRKKKNESIEEIFGIVLVILILGIYYLTKSWTIAGVFGGIYFVSVLIILAIVANKRKERLRASGITEIDKMSGLQFEKFLVLLFQDLGYSVKTTPTTGDFGADLVLNKVNRTIVVQAKRYSKSVGIKAIQEVLSAVVYCKIEVQTSAKNL